MQKITAILLICFATVLLLPACKKNQSNEDYQEMTEPDIPVFTEKINATVSGFIMDEHNEPIAGAAVTAGAIVLNTDEYGYFKMPSASLTKNIGLVKVEKTGYFSNFKSFVAKAGEEHFFRLMLLRKTASGTVASGTGGTIQTTDGASVLLPANAAVNAATGAAYAGTIHVSARVLPVSATNEMLFAIPGDARGLNASGHLKSLNAYASIVVDLNGDAGQKLQLANNIKATVTMPIAASLLANAPSSIALWSFEEEKGVWKEEGTLIKSGTNYTGQTSHFSYWSGATGLSLVNFTAQVLNSGLQPLSNVPVVITIAGQPLNAGYGKFAFTDANGFVNGGIPANTSFVLNVMTTCSNNAYNHFFATANSNIDLGAITGNLGQAVVTLTGTATSCNGQPLTNGYVQTYDHGFYNRIPLVNGNFSFTGISCTNLPINYIVVDDDTHQQSAPQSISLSAGNNNLGALSACGINTLGTATYVIDGISRTLAEPAFKLWAIHDPASGYTTIANIPPTSGGSEFSFQFDGGISPGSAHKVRDVWSVGYANGRAYSTAGLDVTITEFGDVGGFISGYFSGQLLGFMDNTLHNVSYNFRIKRVN